MSKNRAVGDDDLRAQAECVIGKLQELVVNCAGWVSTGMSETALKAMREAMHDGWSECGWGQYFRASRAANSPATIAAETGAGEVTEAMVEAAALAFARDLRGPTVLEPRSAYLIGMRAALQAALTARQPERGEADLTGHEDWGLEEDAREELAAYDRATPASAEKAEPVACKGCNGFGYQEQVLHVHGERDEHFPPITCKNCNGTGRSTTEAEPVAWEWTSPNGKKSGVVSTDISEHLKGTGYTSSPLYATPARIPSDQSEAVREALTGAIFECRGSSNHGSTLEVHFKEGSSADRPGKLRDILARLGASA